VVQIFVVDVVGNAHSGIGRGYESPGQPETTGTRYLVHYGLPELQLRANFGWNHRFVYVSNNRNEPNQQLLFDQSMPDHFSLRKTTQCRRLIVHACCCLVLLVAIGETTTASAQSDAQKRDFLNGLLDRLADEPDDASYILEEIESLGREMPDAIPKVLPFLTDSDTDIQRYATGAFLTLGGSRKQVWAMTKAQNGWTRLNAALALSKHGESPTDLMPLLSDRFATIRAELGVALIESGIEPIRFFHLLKDEDYEVRQQIGVALTEAKVDPQIVTPLLTDEIEDVRLGVAIALLERKTAFDAIKPLLSDELPQVRSQVGVAICEAFGPVPELTPLLRDHNPNVRKSIAISLIDADCKEERVWFLLNDEAKPVREKIAFELLYRLSPNREPLLDILADSELLDVDAYRSLGPKSRAYLIPKLIEAEAAEQLNHFLHLDASSIAWLTPLLRSSIPEVQELTFELLARCITDSENILADDLRKSLRGLGPGQQSFALELVKERQLRSMIPDVMKLMSDTEDRSIRFEAALTIARLVPENAECIRVLLGATEKDLSFIYKEKIATNGPRISLHESTLRKAMDEPKVRGQSWNGQRIRVDSNHVGLCRKLISSGGGDGLKAVIRWLNDPSCTPLALERLLKILENWEGDIVAAGPAVAALLDHSEETVRESAATTLANKKVPLEPSKLAALLDDPNTKISHRAAQLLEFCEPTYQVEVANIFKRCLTDDDFVVKAFAVRWLAKRKVGEPPLAALYEVLLDNDFLISVDTTGAGCDEAINEATTLMNAELPAALAEVAKTDEDLKPLIRKALTKDATDSQLRALLEQLLLTATDSQSRAKAAEQLRELGDKRSLPALTRALEDEADYSYMISNHLGGTGPIRSLVLRAITDIGPSVSMQPKLAKYLFERWTSGDAATALGAIGPAANKSLPLLRRVYQRTKNDDVALAIVQIETNESERVKILRQLLAPNRPRPDGYANAPIDKILEAGEIAKQLIPDLKFMVEEHELLHRDHRADAAYALAILEPENSTWRDYLLQQSRRDDSYFDQPTRRLQQLDARKKSDR
jgi:HEAT repeat protein